MKEQTYFFSDTVTDGANLDEELDKANSPFPYTRLMLEWLRWHVAIWWDRIFVWWTVNAPVWPKKKEK